jgi:glutathione-independent formaldehyde dehydrogenase
VPYADFNLLKFPDRSQALEKIQDLALLSDILPTGYHGAIQAGVGSGSTVYVAGAGPVGLCCAISSHFLGAAVVIVGDSNPDRLALAKKIGCETIDISKTESLTGSIRAILGVPQVDCSVECVGFEAHGLGRQSHEEAPLLNPLIEATRVPGAIGVPGLYLPEDPGAADDMRKKGLQTVNAGLAWVKGHRIWGGQCPVMKYHRELMEAILHDRIHPGRFLNVTLIPLEQAAQAYKDFDGGVAKKFVFDPHAIAKALKSAA